LNHHTKDKGDVGVAKIISDLTSKGFKLLVPLAEHLPFDLVVYCKQKDRFYKVQCKYKKKTRGVISMNLTTSYSSNNKCHTSRYADVSYDIMAIYCPDTDSVYYISDKETKHLSSGFTLRVDEARNCNNKLVRLAKDYLNFPQHSVSSSG
jgi:hypothetical protein